MRGGNWFKRKHAPDPQRSDHNAADEDGANLVKRFAHPSRNQRVYDRRETKHERHHINWQAAVGQRQDHPQCAHCADSARDQRIEGAGYSPLSGLPLRSQNVDGH